MKDTYNAFSEWLINNLTSLTYSELTLYQQETLEIQIVTWITVTVIAIVK